MVTMELSASGIAAAGGAVFLEDDVVAVHKDLQFGVGVQAHAGAQLFGQNDAPQCIDAADNAGAFHSIPFSFV